MGGFSGLYQWYSTLSLFLIVVFKTPEVSFDNTSPGHFAMVIYEWKDVQYLGKITTPETDDNLPVSLSLNTYGT